MAQRMLLERENNDVQHLEGCFSVKPFYDMFQLNAYDKPSCLLTNTPSSGGEDGLKSERISHIPSPSTFGNDPITSPHGDGRFKVTLAKCYANYLYALILSRRVGALLPSYDIMATFICNGRRYKVKFFGRRKIKRFGSGWRKFVKEQNLAEGDHLKFQIKESSDQQLVLDVDITKCTIIA